MTKLPTLAQVDKARKKDLADFGNEILYDLCRNHFYHKEASKIIAKVLFIGRIYAAAIERRKNRKDALNDNFYIDKVVPAFRRSKLDKHLGSLKKSKELTIDNLIEVLQIHKYLTAVIKKITDLDKRSFCSKYLHFHLPNLFFIYDRRAESAMRQFTKQVPPYLKHILKSNKIDIKYAVYFCKCFDLKERIECRHKIRLTMRELDSLLVEIANNESSK